MSILASVIRAYNIAPERIKFWDRSNGRQNQGVGINSTTPLAQYTTPSGWIGVLTHWQVYYREQPPAVPPTEGDLWFLNDTVGAFFSLSKNGDPIPGLNEIRQLSNPWGGNLYPAEGTAFYMSEFGRTHTDWQLSFSVGAALPAEQFELAGRMIGFDFPAFYLDRSQTDQGAR